MEFSSENAWDFLSQGLGAYTEIEKSKQQSKANQTMTQNESDGVNTALAKQTAAASPQGMSDTMKMALMGGGGLLLVLVLVFALKK
ncbi:hypothetical protein [Vibrio crassostreae]|uniref:hypothetical protein n=1 Tax=Vibrio crassostreae TaxID=246167 RepID=UPI0010537218|nr:hypothetical protein [Vibrio crassostreae]TCT60144.1 hypothetical protein EDB31_15412 [Vibrio crassostreae]